MAANWNSSAIENKMRAAGLAGPTIAAFLNAVGRARAGDTGLWPEADIEPVAELPRLECAGDTAASSDALRQLAIIKLNGGLGTGMGLEQAKSLLVIKDGDNFLDFIARQVLGLRGGQAEPLFYLMDSFSTQSDTLGFLRKYPDLWRQETLDFLQSRVPKVDPQTYEPVAWPAAPELEWCPPGHGDLYPSMLGCGLMDQLLRRGVKYLFVSNADNLGATVDLRLLDYFARSGLSFLMEVAERTAADRKGGHLACRRADGRLILRESVQCPKADEAQFQDIQRHRFFNTNNLWIRLDRLPPALARNGGALPLPLIKNIKTVDPRDASSPKVLQLESAMGAAIECFDQTGAIVVPRTRFAPVKTTSDLLALRSDAYVVTNDFRLVLADARQGEPPLIDLDARHYKVMQDFDRYFAEGAPSLVNCRALKVTGPLRFAKSVVCEGAVELVNDSSEPKTVQAGHYRDQRREF